MNGTASNFSFGRFAAGSGADRDVTGIGTERGGVDTVDVAVIGAVDVAGVYGSAGGNEGFQKPATA